MNGQGQSPDTMTPEQRQFLMAQMQRMIPGMQQPQMPRLGGPNATLPTGTAVPRAGGVQPAATPPRPQGGVSGHGAFGTIIGSVMAVKQKMSNDKREKARALAGQYIAMMNSGDPKLQQAAQQLLGDPKNHKIFDKAISDPNSPEYQGVQMAYRDVMKEDQAKQSFQEMQARIQQQQALAQQEQARARDLQSLATTRGQVTESEVYKEEQKNERTKMQIDARLQQSRQSIEAMNKRAANSIASLEKRAALAQRGAKERAGMRQQQSQAANAMLKEYRNIQSEISNLDREQKDMQDNMSRSPITSWITGQADEYTARSAMIESKRTQLETRLQALDASVDAMTQGGVIPREASAAKAGGPIVVKPEDMK